MNQNEMYMRRAIELAGKGAGAVNPNPLVGAVIVKDGRIIGEGYHARYGGLHAERAAFAALKEDAEGACMYVTLEPCCHFGKQPPCTHAIVEHKIRKVYIGSNDPNDKVAGKGIEYLRANGIEVETGLLKAECDELNRVFFHYITKHMPYVVMKYAMTMDGKIACKTGDSKWITGEAARQRVQESRNLYTGIMVGIQTVCVDDPMLTCRIEGGRNPVRIICDTNFRLSLETNIVKTAAEVPTICAIAEDVYKNDISDGKNEAFRRRYELAVKAGVKFLHIERKNGHINLTRLLEALAQEGIDGILLEGGGTLNYSFVAEGLVDEVHQYIGPKIFGGASARTPVEGEGISRVSSAALYKRLSVEELGEDILIRYVKRDK